MGIRIIVSWIEITLRVVVRTTEVWTWMRMSKCNIPNVMVGKLSTRIIHIRNVMRQIQQVLSLLQLMNEATVLFHGMAEVRL